MIPIDYDIFTYKISTRGGAIELQIVILLTIVVLSGYADPCADTAARSIQIARVHAWPKVS